MLTIDASTASYLAGCFGSDTPIGRKAEAVLDWLNSEPAASSVVYDSPEDFIPDDALAGLLVKALDYYPEYTRRAAFAAALKARRDGAYRPTYADMIGS
jgi:hypothetical protein